MSKQHKGEDVSGLKDQLRAIVLEAEKYEAVIHPATVAATWIGQHGDVSGNDAQEVRDMAHYGAYHLAREVVGRRGPGPIGPNPSPQEVLEGFEVLTQHHPVIRDGEMCEVHVNALTDDEWLDVYESHINDADDCSRKKREYAELERYHRKFADEMRKYRPAPFKRRKAADRGQTHESPDRTQ